MRTDSSGNSTDWALAKLSIVAFQKSYTESAVAPHDLQGNKSEADIADAIRARIKNPSVREFSNAASLLFGKFSSIEIISQVRRLEKVSEQMLLLRLWVTQNRTNPEAGDVIEYALDLLLRKSTDLSPNARLYRELASPLPHINDPQSLPRLLVSFDSHKGSIERLGPSEEYVRLQITLARAEFQIDPVKARSRLEEIYVYSSDVGDLSAKAGCLAWLWGAMPLIDPEKTMEQESRLHSSIEQELHDAYSAILAESAEQYIATKAIIHALSRTRSELTMSFIKRLNLASRRDFAMADFVELLLRQKPEQLRADTLFAALNEISTGWLKDYTMVLITETLANSPQVINSRIAEFLPILERIEQMKSLTDRCRAYSNLYVALGGDDASLQGQTRHVIQKLGRSWDGIDTGWHKVDVGFKIASCLARSGISRAREFLANTEQIRADLTLDSDAAAQSYVSCVMLTIRAYSGLLPKAVDTDHDIERVAELIARIPSIGQRAILWGEVAIRYYSVSRVENLRRCVSERINPLLADLHYEDMAYCGEILRAVAPALYCSHSESAFEQIARLSVELQDICYEQIVLFLLRKVPVSDPYETIPGQTYKLSSEHILDICTLLTRFQSDYRIYSAIKSVTDSMTAKKHRDIYTRELKTAVAKRLLTLIAQKLPASGGIQHDGYKLCCQAQIARLEGNNLNSFWESLSEAGRRIQNTSDRAFVLGTIAVAMRFDGKNTDLSDKLIREAKAIVDSISIEFDRRERYEFLSTLICDIDKSLWKECIESALLTKLPTHNPLEQLRLQKRTIDLAHTLDPSYAASLISLIDDDPARQHEKAAMRVHLDVLDFKKKMLEGFHESNEQKFGHKHIDNGEAYAEAAWRNLGSLNAGRVATVHFEYTREFIRVAANFPIGQSYPILAWIIENAIRRLSKTDNVRSHIRPIFEATLIASELAERMAVRSARQQRRLAPPIGQKINGSSHLIRPGERDRALAVLRAWCEQNVKDALIICDPFFGPDDLEILQLIRGIAPKCAIEILTSAKHHNNERIAKPWEETYRNSWRRLSSQDPPDTKLVIVGAKSSGEHPMHDRWWLAGDTGLRIGTSLNSLGISKESEISYLKPDEATSISMDICLFLRQNRREFKGERLDYSIFTL